jgi:hypothetical protein
MKKRKRLSHEEWAAIETENAELAERLANRLARMRAELDEKRRMAAERPARRKRLLGFL